MDWMQIAGAAIAGAVAKEVVAALVGLIKGRVSTPTWLKPWMNRDGFAVAVDLIAIVFISGLAVHLFSPTEETATRGDLLTLYGLCFALVVFSVSLLLDVLKLKLGAVLRARQ